VLKPAGTELRADLYAIPGVQLHRADRALHVWSEAPLAVLGSAIVGAELARTRHIVNMHVHKDYDGRAPGADLTALARAWGIVEPFAGLMTAARLDQAQVAIEEGAGATVAAIVSVGLQPSGGGRSHRGHAPSRRDDQHDTGGKETYLIRNGHASAVRGLLRWNVLCPYGRGVSAFLLLR
jgi:adenosylcobinamide amidohydrolase